jgi:hypothetical protein
MKKVACTFISSENASETSTAILDLDKLKSHFPKMVELLLDKLEEQRNSAYEWMRDEASCNSFHISMPDDFFDDLYTVDDVYVDPPCQVDAIVIIYGG